MTKVLLVVPPYDYNDRQLVIISNVLTQQKVDFIAVNSTGQSSKGQYGTMLTPQTNFYQVSSKDFDAVIFIGGNGAVAYEHNRRALQLAKEFFEAGKVVGAIGLSPSILVYADILKGKRATGRPTERDIINSTALYTGAPIEIDGKIITAISTAVATEFARAVIDAARR
jgi:protease I